MYNTRERLCSVGATIHLSGVDIVNGTPILDIKPYIPEYDCPSTEDKSNTELSSERVTGSDVKEKVVHNNSDGVQAAKWINNKGSDLTDVIFTDRASQQLEKFQNHTDSEYSLNFLKNSSEARRAIADILLADPRSSYRRKSCIDRLYYFTVDTIHVTCWFDGSIAEVVKVQHISECDFLTDSLH